MKKMCRNLYKWSLLSLISLNGWPVTLDEMIKLEKQLGDDAIVPSSFTKECYSLVSKEENPRHVKMLEKILDAAQTKDRDEVFKILKDFESVLKSE